MFISCYIKIKIEIKIKTIQECLYKALSILSTLCQCPVFAVIAPLTRNKQYGNDDLLNCDEDDTWERLALRVRKCVWGEFMELYLSCKWIPGLRNTSGELVVNWPESCPRSAEHPHSHNFILLDFLISSWFTFSFTRMYLNFYGPFRIQITEDRDIWGKYLKYFKEEVGENFPKVTVFFPNQFFGLSPYDTLLQRIFLFFFSNNLNPHPQLASSKRAHSFSCRDFKELFW